MRPIFALGFLLLGVNSAVPEPKQPNTLVAAADAPTAPIAIDRLIGSIDLDSDVALPSLEVIEASHEQEDSTAAPPRSGEAATIDAAVDQDVASLDGLCNALFDSAQHNNLPVPFFANLIWQESRLRHDAVSPVGALGIAQFMPRVAAAVGLADPLDPRQALPASARLLHELRDRFGNLGFVAAAYNAGVRRVSDWLLHGGRLPRETQTYVVRITGRSVEEWRKTPLDDSALRFVRPLPCRELPAFANLEQAQAEQVQEARQDQPQQSQAAAAQPAPVARRYFARRPPVRAIIARRAAAAVRQLAGTIHGGRAVWLVQPQAAPRLAVQIRAGAHEARRFIRPQLVPKLAGNFHGVRGEVRHHQRILHDRRRIARRAAPDVS